MSSRSDVEAVYRQLQSATTYANVFGPLPNGDIKVQRGWVRKQFSYLAQIVHPDHAPDAADIASTAFDDLRKLFNAAERAIEAGSYDNPFRAGHRSDTASKFDSFFELRSPTMSYRVDSTPYRTGDFSILYRACCTSNGFVDAKITPDREVLVKIAKQPTNNALLEVEAKRIKKFRDTDTMKGIYPFLPELLDTFIVPGPDRKQFRATVMSFNPAMLSLTDIVKAFPDGLIPQHAAWIVRRVMAQTLAASMAGLVHASITPDHVLVDPIKHEPLHIGWLHGVEKVRLTMIVDRWKDWYPPEIFSKKIPDQRTDLYMAAVTSIWLFAGDTRTKVLPKTMPDGISRLLRRCVATDPNQRPSDGLLVLNEITKAIRDAWGRSYQPLHLPL